MDKAEDERRLAQPYARAYDRTPTTDQEHALAEFGASQLAGFYPDTERA